MNLPDFIFMVCRHPRGLGPGAALKPLCRLPGFRIFYLLLRDRCRSGVHLDLLVGEDNVGIVISKTRCIYQVLRSAPALASVLGEGRDDASLILIIGGERE